MQPEARPVLNFLRIKKALKINDLSAFNSEWFPIW